jgi:hypothetical protein
MKWQDLSTQQRQQILQSIKKIRISSIKADLICKDVGGRWDFVAPSQNEVRVIQNELHPLLRDTLTNAGYELVETGEDAELSVIYRETVQVHMVGLMGNVSAKRSFIAEIYLTLLTREYGKVSSKRISKDLPDNLPSPALTPGGLKNLFGDELQNELPFR